MRFPARIALPLLLLAAACAQPASQAAAPAETAGAGYRIVNTYPHDPGAFTQGLFYRDGHLYESTGLVGRSTIRKVRLEDGRVLRSVSIPPRLFGEGITDFGPEIVSITWQSGIGFRWDRDSFRRLGEFRYPGEGWGLTQDGSSIIMSDGTATLRFLDPATMRERRRLAVTAEGVPVERLNELEWVKGEIFANVWMSGRIARIDPTTGRVTGWIDLTDLAAEASGGDPDSVLNGIAYDAAGDRLFVTGKNWPKLYEIRLDAPDRR
ncbi:MAG TPA: glutaminyl-peptide cyclotransferase [Allosphingosinicella sp.]|nr:glutaminyl-peptide cyclotransferase [Allosphingosinicella sp.]